MPWLTRCKYTADQYVEIYAAIIRKSAGPLFMHWLGEMFMPELRGYFPGDSFERVMDVDPAKVRGAKLSLSPTSYNSAKAYCPGTGKRL